MENDDDEMEIEQLIDVFQHEDLLQQFYQPTETGKTSIVIDQVEEMDEKPLYVALDCKEMTSQLDLRKEVIMTMLNQLEQVDGAFFRVDSVLPNSIGIRFHARSLEDLVDEH